MVETYFIILNRLDEDERYSWMSVWAKYLYGKMRDILKLSIKNGWKDERGYYIRMTRVKMGLLLGIALPTVRKVIKELIKAGLLEDVREGLTRSNRLYVKLLEGEDELAFQTKVKETAPPLKKPDFTLERNKVSPNQGNLTQRHSTPEENKKEHFWVLREGSIFKYRNSFWIHEKGQVTPYRFGDDLKNGAMELLSQLGMKSDDISLAMAGISI
ncbi:replication initiator protein A [Eubacteriales bacterium OttesenSCG-928-A19]|nr:replication initiator protein A [Eubacteriales bacterium OttesenSCG-928-A19]